MKNFNYTDGGYQIKMESMCTVVLHFRLYVYGRFDTTVLYVRDVFYVRLRNYMYFFFKKKLRNFGLDFKVVSPLSRKLQKRHIYFAVIFAQRYAYWLISCILNVLKEYIFYIITRSIHNIIIIMYKDNKSDGLRHSIDNFLFF